MPIAGIIASSISGHLTTGNFFLISQQTLASTTATVTFSSIPSTYKSLQIRYNTLTPSVGLVYYAQFNGDTGNNYAWHALTGNSSATIAAGVSSTNHIPVGVWDTGSGGATAPTVGIVDMVDYANTSKYKTVKSISGTDDNSTRHDIDLDSGLWLSTAAINSISIATPNFNAGSTFSLYGVS